MGTRGWQKGRKAHRRKLTDAQAAEIRALAAEGMSSRKIGAKYDINHTSVLHIIKNKIFG
jgi:DNA invertase Pin-like site-specific DNA recombinase